VRSMNTFSKDTGIYAGMHELGVAEGQLVVIVLSNQIILTWVMSRWRLLFLPGNTCNK
jgi:hypothetical protein